MALVLCTGADPALMRTRQLILQHAGHKVLTATDEHTVRAACQQHPFDVAVIGQALPSNLKRRIAFEIRRHSPSTKILELYQISMGRTLPDADSWLEVPAEVPQELAESVTALATRAQKQSG